MYLTKLAIEKKQLSFMLTFMRLAAGAYSYFDISRSQDPGFIFRQAQIVTQFPGASPERVETLVTDKIEEKIRQIPELEYITSESRTGVSIIIVSIHESERDTRPIWDNLQRKVNEAERELPEGVISPVVNDDFGDIYGVIYGITGEDFSYSEIKKVADDTRDGLLVLSDIAKIEVLGVQAERIFIEYKPNRLNEYGISPGYEH
ncbi:MAG: efflux RND transporter permease subunit [Sneathiella sp.]|nr:efflux RND transporter permease subunit [Sneathiella sp.]